MNSPILDKIASIKAKADQEIHSLREQAATELAKKLTEAKVVLRDLEIQYEELTGKTVRGDNVSGTRLPKAKMTNEAIAAAIKGIPGKLTASLITRSLNINPKTFNAFLSSSACNIQHNGLEKKKSAYVLK